MNDLTTIDTTTTDNVAKLAKKSSDLANAVHEAMDKLGVTRLANCYLSITENSTHGTQYQLHIDGHDGDLERTTIDNSSNTCLDFGDYNLQYSYPTLDCVLEFLASISAINQAINTIKENIASALNIDVTINS